MPRLRAVPQRGSGHTRLASVLADLPVLPVGRLRSDRVMLRDAGPRRSTPRGGQPRKHGGVLRRFDLEHTFRLFKQTLGWTVPMARAPDPART
ncbi:hypothetical protein [Streptomyces parvus]|uniref:hypothetical protein n=1 Tax=Streptomyces parvus TaxID=66428 RepID=UPI003640CA84